MFPTGYCLDALDVTNKKIKGKGDYANQMKGYVEDISGMAAKEQLVSLNGPIRINRTTS